MVSIRRGFGKWVTRTVGGFGVSKARFSSGSVDPLQIANLAWSAMFVVSVLVSALTVYWLSATPLQAEISMALIWGVFIGVTLLFFFPPKLLITIAGGLVGMLGSDLGGMANVIEKTSQIISKTIQTLNAALGGDVTIHPISAWLFLTLIFICCLPAYRSHS